MENCELQPGEPIKTPKIENVGEAFIDWAEKNWDLNELITTGLRIKEKNNDNCESCPYSVFREIFISKINELVKNKV